MGNGRGTIDWLITHSDAFDRRWVQQSVRYSSVSFSFWMFLSFVFLYDVLKPQSSSTNLFGFELMAVVVWVQLSERTNRLREAVRWNKFDLREPRNSRGGSVREFTEYKKKRDGYKSKKRVGRSLDFRKEKGERGRRKKKLSNHSCAFANVKDHFSEIRCFPSLSLPIFFFFFLFNEEKKKKKVPIRSRLLASV